MKELADKIGEVVMAFGKFKGKLVKDLYDTEKGYLEFFAGKDEGFFGICLNVYLEERDKE